MEDTNGESWIMRDESPRSAGPPEGSRLSLIFQTETVLRIKQLADHLKEANLNPANPLFDVESRPKALESKYNELDSLLNEIIDPSVRLGSHTIDQCFRLIASGEPVNDFYKHVLKYDTSATCGLVWQTQYMAYRCRTCGLTPSMSLCAPCFREADHQGHDFNMFKSQAGGACDCGDVSVMKPIGFCPRHRMRTESDIPQPPKYIMSVAEFLVPKIICRMLLHFRLVSSVAEEVLWEDNVLLKVLTKLTELGALSHSVLTEALLSTNVYESFKETATESRKALKTAIGKTNSIVQDYVAENLECPELGPQLVHKHCLDELTFWLIFFKFPRDFVVFLLNLLPNETYKLAFYRSYALHYSRIAEQLASCEERERLDNRVIHVSVQLLSNERLTSRLVQDHKLHLIILSSIQGLVNNCLKINDIHVDEDNEHEVVDCSKPQIDNHNYWPMVSDLHSLLDHPTLAIKFMRDPLAIDLWCSLLSKFQGMLLNVRQLEHHVEYESRDYYVAFTGEAEVCSQIMWSLALGVDDSSLSDCLLLVMQRVQSKLGEWFDEIKFTPDSCWHPPPLQISFHLPLHRHLAAFAIRARQKNIEWPIPCEYFIRQVFMHPLMIQVVRAEIGANMWVRNGMSMRHQMGAYAQSPFAPSFIDLDIHLLQLCANYVKSDWFILMILERYHLADWLSFSQEKPGEPFLLDEWVTPVLQGTLRLLCTILSQRLNIDMNDEQISRLELATVLCMGDPKSSTGKDRTHSQLIEDIPDRKYRSSASLGSADFFDQQINELADYCEPHLTAAGTMSQGMYSPKSSTWINEYDPLFCMHRCLFSRDYQQCIDRYNNFVRKQLPNFGSSDLTKLWPPYRIPPPQDVLKNVSNILETGPLHSFLWIILYRWWKEASSVSESNAQLAIFLLELSVNHASPTSSPVVHASGTVLDLYISTWFSHDSILANMSKNIDRILSFSKKHSTLPDKQPTEMPDLYRLHLRPPNDMTVAQSPSKIAFIDASGENKMKHTRFDAAVQALPSYFRKLCLQGPPAKKFIRMEGEAIPSNDSRQVAICQHDQTNAPIVTEFDSDDSNESAPESAGTSSSAEDQGGSLVPYQPPQKSQRMKALPSSVRQEHLPPGAPSPKALPAPNIFVTETGSMSITTILLNLYDRVAAQICAPLYAPPNLPYVPPESRIGTACLFIGNILNMAYTKDQQCQSVIDQWCRERDERLGLGAIEQSPSPSSPNLPPKSRDESRRNAARIRQQKLMEQFNKNQKRVMEQFFREPSNEVAKEAESEEVFQCAICTRNSTTNVFKRERRFMGMVVLCQPSSVLGMCRSREPPELMQIEDPRSSESDSSCRAFHFRNYIDNLLSAFRKSSCIRAVNSVWYGGMSVKSCGHYIHSDCHQTYMQSLRNDRTNNLARLLPDEFSCPVCRRRCNAVMPILPPRNNKLMDDVDDPVNAMLNLHFHTLFNADQFPPWFKDCIESFCDMFWENADHVPKCREVINDENAEIYNKSMFLDSILRGKLELDALHEQPSTPSMQLFSQRLLSIVSVCHCFKEDRSVNQVVLRESWCQLQQINHQLDSLIVEDKTGSVPLLLQDPIALLLQLTQYLNFCMAPSYAYELAERRVCRLTVLQSYLRVRCAQLDANNSSTVESSSSVCQKLMQMLGSNQNSKDEEQDNIIVVQMSDELNAYTKLIKEWRYMVGCTNGLNASEEAMALMNGSWCEDVTLQTRAYVKQLFHWINGEDFRCPAGIKESGSRPLASWIAESKLRMMLRLPLLGWSPPRLLRLPYNFEHLFHKFSSLPCSRCHSVPKESLMCLLCGQLVCHKTVCCKLRHIPEIDTHAHDCGVGSAVFLSINSSMVHVVHHRRTAIWGSIYLDKHGEEDSGLKRGRPLMLSDQRLSLLQKQWVSGSYDSTIKQWFISAYIIDDPLVMPV